MPRQMPGNTRQNACTSLPPGIPIRPNDVFDNDRMTNYYGKCTLRPSCTFACQHDIAQENMIF